MYAPSLQVTIQTNLLAELKHQAPNRRLQLSALLLLLLLVVLLLLLLPAANKSLHTAKVAININMISYVPGMIF